MVEIPHYSAITGMFRILGLNKCAATFNWHRFSATNILNDTFPHKTATSPHVLSEEDLQRQKDEGSSREAAKAKAGKPRQDAAWGRKGFFSSLKNKVDKKFLVFCLNSATWQTLSSIQGVSSFYLMPIATFFEENGHPIS